MTDQRPDFSFASPRLLFPIVGLIQGIALYVLTIGKPPASSTEMLRPAMDEIDAESRAAMRELLRAQGED